MIVKSNASLTSKGEITKGISKAGKEWAKLNIVADCGDANRTNPVSIEVFGTDNVEKVINLPVGCKVSLAFTIGAREYNGKWYNDVRLWDIEAIETEGTQVASNISEPTVPDALLPVQGDLPF